MRWGLVVVVALIGVGNIQAEDRLSVPSIQSPPVILAQTEPEERLGARFLKACDTELKNRNLPASAVDCEKLLERSNLMQSGAIQYLAQADDKEREAFSVASTLVRYEIVAPDVDPKALVPLLLDQTESTTPGMVVHLAKDVMKSSCGYYQIDILMKALSNADSLPQQPKKTPGKLVKLEYKSCIGGALQEGKITECLNPIFQIK